MSATRTRQNTMQRICERCAVEFWADKWNIARHPETCGRYCSRQCARDATANQPADMWRYVEKSEGCWLWTSATTAAGYGVFRLGGRKGIAAYVHRLAWALTHGPIPDGLEVCHHCDTPPCCNPDHLFLGTHSDNMRDMARKGRNRGARRHHVSNP